MPTQFTDNDSHTWDLTLSIGTVARVRKQLGVDLLAPHLGEPPLIARLHEDPVLLIDVIYTIVQPKAEPLGVSGEALAEAIGGGAGLAAYLAFMEAMADFFQKLHREDLEKIVRTYQTVAEKDVARNQATVERVAQIALRQAEAQVEAKLAELERSGDGSGPTSAS